MYFLQTRSELLTLRDFSIVRQSRKIGLKAEYLLNYLALVTRELALCKEMIRNYSFHQDAGLSIDCEDKSGDINFQARIIKRAFSKIREMEEIKLEISVLEKMLQKLEEKARK